MQSQALVVLVFLDAMDQVGAEDERLRLAMLASGKFDHQRLFPEIFTESVASNAAGDLDASDELDLTEVEWMSGGAAMAEWEKVMAALRGAQSGTIVGDGVGVEPTWTEWS